MSMCFTRRGKNQSYAGYVHPGGTTYFIYQKFIAFVTLFELLFELV